MTKACERLLELGPCYPNEKHSLSVDNEDQVYIEKEKRAQAKTLVKKKKKMNRHQ